MTSGQIIENKEDVDEMNTIIQEIYDAKIGALKDEKNNNLVGQYSDAESIELFQGGYIVSFERKHRILKYDDLNKSSEVLTSHKTFQDWPFNGGMEAMGVIDNHIICFSEDMVLSNGNLEVYFFKNNKKI